MQNLFNLGRKYGATRLSTHSFACSPLIALFARFQVKRTLLVKRSWLNARSWLNFQSVLNHCER